VHITVINFNLKDLSPGQFAALCDELAPAFAATPGLLTKVWLADEAANTFGGVYTWRDEQALRDFEASELFKAVASHPNFANISARSFSVLEAPTRITRGLPLAGVA
jgi:quinol monooxygenase YgiN